MEKEIKYYGIHACLALALKRPQDIIRVYLDESNVKTFAPLLKYCAQHRKIYRIIPTIELDKVSNSVHHEGVCILAKQASFLSVDVLFKDISENACLLYLDGIENPHNFGSILRTAAHFGVSYVLGENLPLTPSACRIAKGGAEIVQLVSLKRPLDTLMKLKERGFTLVATSSHRGESLYRFSMPARTIFALGSESAGLKTPILKQASCLINIHGTGTVESLNVSVATGLCLGEYFRQHGK